MSIEHNDTEEQSQDSQRGEEFCRNFLSRFGYRRFEDFEADVKNATRNQLKLDISEKLIDMGYPRPLDLYRALPESKARHRLTIKLLELGIIPIHSREAMEGEKYMVEEVDARGNIRELMLTDMPIEVIGQIMTLELFHDVTDEDKLEELRSWATHAMLRPYIGTITGERHRKELTTVDLLDRVPQTIFTNRYAIRYNLIARYFEQRYMRIITDLGLEDGLRQVEEDLNQTQDDDRKSFIEGIQSRLLDVATFPLPLGFKSKIMIKGQKRQFPSFEQRAFCYDFIKSDCRLLTADTGLGKTASAFLAMEHTDTSRVLVLAPASGKQTWQVEANVVFEDPDKVFIVNGSEELTNPALLEKKYIVVSQELLGMTRSNPVLMEQLNGVLIEKAKVDGLIIDEIDGLNSKDTISVKTALSLAGAIRRNYQERTGSQNAPVIGLSATPIRSGISDLNIPMAILYPERYAANIGESTNSRKTFSDTILNRPDLAYFALVGERRMSRWESATGVQELQFRAIEINASPFEEYLYDFISDVGTNTLNKIRLLEDTLLNPLLVKAEVRILAGDKIPKVDIDEVLETLRLVIRKWRQMRGGIDFPQDEADYLSADRLVELGFGEMVLGCFFHGAFENGIDSLVETLIKTAVPDQDLFDLAMFWQKREVSSKYQVLREEIQRALTWRALPEGTLARNKVFIVSPSRAQGRTRDVVQRDIKRSDGTLGELYAPWELEKVRDSQLKNYIRTWIEGLCGPENLLLLDGSVGVGKPKERIISHWVNNPNKAVLLATLEATYQSRDYTVNSVVDDQNRRIDGITKIFLGWPWYWQQFKQMVGRSQRQGQLVPVNNMILEILNLIDTGKGGVVRFTELLTRITLSGAKLHPTDQAFMDSKRVGDRIPFQSADARYMRDAYGYLRGSGEDLTGIFMGSLSIDGEKNNNQKFAERYYDEGRDEYTVPGYNAQMLAHLIRRLNLAEGRILSLGAGTLLLQRKLAVGIDNVDINPYMMEAGWQVAQQYGGRVVPGRVSSLTEAEFPSGNYDLAEDSFAFHWSRLHSPKENSVADSERVKILGQINRVLKVGGTMVLTLPESTFDSEKFATFTNTLERCFGFKVDRDFSGKSYGISAMGLRKRLGWCIVACKEAEPELPKLNLIDLEFLNETREWVSRASSVNRARVAHPDYPDPDLHLEFDLFEIINSDNEIKQIEPQEQSGSGAPTNGHIVDGAHDDEQLLDVNSLDINLNEATERFNEQLGEFLKGDTPDDYRIFRRNLMRPMVDIVQRGWREVEVLSAELLKRKIERDRRLPKTRLEAYSWIINEARRTQDFYGS